MAKKSNGFNMRLWLKRHQKKLNDSLFDTYPEEYKYIVVFNDQNGKCNTCKHDVWMKEPIPLTMVRIDGDEENHSRENIELLCYNCSGLRFDKKARSRKWFLTMFKK